MAAGGLKTLFRSSDVYGSPTDYVFMMFANSFLNAHAQAVSDYASDYLRAVNWSLDNRDEAVQIYASEYTLPVNSREWLPAIHVEKSYSLMPARAS